MPTVTRECTDTLSRTVCNLPGNECFGQPKTLVVGDCSSESAQDTSVAGPVTNNVQRPSMRSANRMIGDTYQDYRCVPSVGDCVQ